MNTLWPNEWRLFTNDKHNGYIRRELEWELEKHADHPLANQEYELIGARNLYDDFVFHLPATGQFGHVHLTWGSLKWPPCKIFSDRGELSDYLYAYENGVTSGCN